MQLLISFGSVPLSPIAIFNMEDSVVSNKGNKKHRHRTRKYDGGIVSYSRFSFYHLKMGKSWVKTSLDSKKLFAVQHFFSPWASWWGSRYIVRYNPPKFYITLYLRSIPNFFATYPYVTLYRSCFHRLTPWLKLALCFSALVYILSCVYARR